MYIILYFTFIYYIKLISFKKKNGFRENSGHDLFFFYVETMFLQYLCNALCT